MANKQPHIIIFNPDQMRADSMGHLGNQAAYTPNLDKFAQEGTSFRNAYVQNPVCTPSRCSFMSGLYPHVGGHRTISHMMHKEEHVLLRELKNEGYHVWTNGRNDLIPAKGKKPFRDYANTVFVPKKKLSLKMFMEELDESDHSLEGRMKSYKYSHYHGTIKNETNESLYDMDAAWVEGAVDFIHNRPKDKPICMFLPLMYPHPPYQVEEKYMDLIDPSKLPSRIKEPNDWTDKPAMLKGLYEKQGLADWTEEMWTHLRATYLAMCARVDEQFGMLVETLKEAGIYEDSAIFFFSDHGDYTGDYGIVEKNQNTFEDCLTNVPFLMKLPDWMNGQKGINDELIELVDFYATVEDITGMKPTHTHFGKSLKSLVMGQVNSHRGAVFCEGGRLKNELHCSEGYHYPELVNEENVYYPRISLQVSQGPEHTKATMMRTDRYKYVKRLDEKDELYDLNYDLANHKNLIDDPSYQNVILEMKNSMLDWLQETSDIVPFEEDERMDQEMILMFLKSQLPWIKYLIVKVLFKIKGGMTINELMAMQKKA